MRGSIVYWHETEPVDRTPFGSGTGFVTFG